MKAPDREVLITVADRLPPERLDAMADDPDYLVRTYVARRMPEGRLFRLIRDPDQQERAAVAERLPAVSLGLMADDTEPEVRRIVAARLQPEAAIALLKDLDWTGLYGSRPFGECQSITFSRCCNMSIRSSPKWQENV